MPFSTPTTDQLSEIAKDLGMNLTEADLTSFQGLMAGYVDAYNMVEKAPDVVPEVTYPRTIAPGPGGREQA